MKKLFLLAIVISIASIASAGLTYKIGGTELADGSAVSSTGSIDLIGVSDGATTSYTIEVETSGDVTLDTGNAGFMDGLMFGNKFVGDPTSTWARLSGDNFTTAIPAGDVFTLPVLGTAGTVTLTDAATDVATTVNVVPEPMTMALLGLGGLLIRRRK